MCKQVAMAANALAECQEMADKAIQSSQKAAEALEGIDWETFHKLQVTKIS